MKMAVTAETISFTTSGKAAEVGGFTASDAELVRRALQSDEAAMETLYNRYEAAVFRLAYRILHCADDADDVRQETFVRVFGSLSRYRQEAAFKTYVLAICSNLCRDRLRGEKRHPEHLYGLEPSEVNRAADATGDPARHVQKEAERDKVRRAIESLSPLHRETLHLRYVEELPMEEIARVAGCSQFAVPVRLFRARKAFEKAFLALD